jgi:hypothetical protein
MTLEKDLLGLVPVATLEGALELIVVEAIDVGENAVLIAEVSEGCTSWGDDGVDGCCGSECADGGSGDGGCASVTRGCGQEG